MSDKAFINQRNIEKAHVYTRGMTAEQAVLWAYDFNIELFPTIFDIKYYLKDKEGYIKHATDNYKIHLRKTDKYRYVPSESSEKEAEKFNGFKGKYVEYDKGEYHPYRSSIHNGKELPSDALALINTRAKCLNNDEFYKQQKEKKQHLAAMIELKKQLLCDIHNQLTYPKDGGLVITRPEILHHILTDDYQEKFDKLYAQHGVEAHDRLPSTTDVSLEEQTVSCVSLYKWFGQKAITVKSWKNLASFQRLPWSKLKPLKNRRDNQAGKRSALVTYGAIIELLAEHIVEHLVDPTGKKQLKRLLMNGKVNTSLLVAYLQNKKPQLIVQKRMLTEHINDATEAFNDEK
jgi:hypothetical protein